MSPHQPLKEFQDRMIIEGQCLFYRKLGKGSPLILLHGYGVSSYIWQRALPSLARYHEVWLVDLPGYGRSPLNKHPWQLRAMAPLLEAWLRKLHLPPVALMGQSMGGGVALHLAAIAPELIERLVLVSSIGMPLGTTLPVLIGRSARSLCQPGGAYPVRMLVDTLTPRPRVWWHCAQEMIRSDLRLEIAQIKHPTLILWGTRDLLLPVQLGYALSRVMPHAHFAELARSGHRPMLTEPAAFSQLVLEFLGK